MIKRITSRFVILSILLLPVFHLSAQEVVSNEKAETWFNGSEWLNGLTLKPHESINVQEFYNQYNKNKMLWDKAFEFLKTNDFRNLSNGKIFLDTTNLFVVVSEYAAKDPENVKWESHKKYIDIQYVADGVEKIGVTPVSKTTDANYDEEKDLIILNCTAGAYYDAKPGVFFIFFPQDAHRPGMKTEGSDKVKKIVVKVRVG